MLCDIYDKNGLRIMVRDGDTALVRYGMKIIVGSIMVFKNHVYFKYKDEAVKFFSPYEVEFLSIRSHILQPQNNIQNNLGMVEVVDNYQINFMKRKNEMKSNWQIGAVYQGPQIPYFKNKLVHISTNDPRHTEVYLTFQRYYPDGRFKNVFTARAREVIGFKMIEPPAISYDPDQQPYDEDDI